MPNFVGIWDQKSTEQGIRQALKTQLHRVRIPGITTNDCLLVEPGLGVALMDTQLLMNGEQPARSPDGRLSLFIDGELYNASELKRSFRSSLPDAELSTAELCVHLIAIHGEEVVRRFNGLFSLVMYDSVAKRLLLISDRYGFRPLFIAQRDSCLLFGSEMKALCAADTRQRHIDEIGTVELFCYGTCFAQQTLIQGYTRLAPATILTADSDGVRFKKYWSYKYEEGGGLLINPLTSRCSAHSWTVLSSDACKDPVALEFYSAAGTIAAQSLPPSGNIICLSQRLRLVAPNPATCGLRPCLLSGLASIMLR